MEKYEFLTRELLTPGLTMSRSCPEEEEGGGDMTEEPRGLADDKCCYMSRQKTIKQII